MILLPTSKGIALAVQAVVPVALEEPQGACHVTFVTPTLSEAVPEIVIVPAVVLIVVPTGEVIAMARGVAEATLYSGQG